MGYFDRLQGLYIHMYSQIAHVPVLVDVYFIAVYIYSSIVCLC